MFDMSTRVRLRLTPVSSGPASPSSSWQAYPGSTVATVGPISLAMCGIDVRALGLSLLWLGRR